MIVMIFGIIIMGAGICLFKLSLMGNDPSSAMVMAIAAKIEVPFFITLIVANAIWFLAEIFLNRRMIGIGTFFNWFCVGLFTDIWTEILTGFLTFPEDFFGRLFVMIAGILILSFACALYQTADMGIAPYDALSLIMAERLPIPYFWCRIITDSVCAVAAFAFGGIVGLGTLVCAFGLGPFVSFFTRTVAVKLCTVEEK